LKLDRATYEAWLLDRLEGALTPEQERELDAFLAAHPELPVYEGELPKVDAGRGAFPDKSVLLHPLPPTGPIDAAHLNDFLAAKLEGDLTETQVHELGRYLYEHPEAARDAAAMAKAKVLAETVRLDEKEALEKHLPPTGLPSAIHLNEFLVAQAEGDLDAVQLAAMEQYLSLHPEARREQRLIAAARVLPEPVAFPLKQALLKRESRVLPLWTRWAAAASIALLLGMGWWWLGNGRDTRPQVAQTGQRTPVPTESTPALAATPKVQEPSAGPDRVPATPPEAGTAGSQAPAGASEPHKAPTGKQRTPQQPPVPSTEKEQPAPVPEPIPSEPEQPHLAQTAGSPAEAPANTELLAATAAAPSAPAGGQDLGTFMANTLRRDLLDAPKRSTSLDGADVLAMADRAIGAVSKGQGGLQVQRSASRERVRLSLGRNFSISASRGR